MAELSYLYTDLEKHMCEAGNVDILIREEITELYNLFLKKSFSHKFVPINILGVNPLKL